MMIQSKVQETNKQRLSIAPYKIYLYLIGGIGLILVVYSVFTLHVDSLLNLALFAFLLVGIQLTGQSLPISKQAGLTFSVTTAIVLCIIQLFGIFAAVLLSSISVIFLTLVKPSDSTTWKRNPSQLFFNNGASVISSAVAGCFFVISSQQTNPTTTLSLIPIWLGTVVLHDQTNWWLVAGIIKLQHGDKLSIREMWLKNHWAFIVNITLGIVVGGLLVAAVQQFDWIGVVVFLLPIALTSYAVHVYVSQTKAQMANLEEIIAERTKDLARLYEEKDAFLAVLTHDMKSPLTSIGMYAEMLQRKPEIIQRKPHTIQNILRAHSTLTNIVNNIVDLENLQTNGAMPLEKNLFDLTELIEYVVEILQPQADKKQIKLTNQLPRNAINIRADRLQIERVLTNLVSNAVKYTQNEGKVDVRVWHALGKVHIAVQDTGYGIPMEDLPHIFERYRRVSKHRNKASGTGLGLAIAKAIAEAHQGTLTVESAEGIGSTFTLSLPLPTEE